jgi:hypothetical protein
VKRLAEKCGRKNGKRGGRGGGKKMGFDHLFGNQTEKWQTEK